MAVLHGPLVSQRFNLSPWKHVREVAAMLKAIHAQEDKEAARANAVLVVGKLRRMKLEKTAELVEKSVEKTFLHGFSV